MNVTERLTTALAGHYRIERELGQGGMATVYLAYDPKHNRNVAIKVLKPELAAVLGADRFVQEIATTAALQHPNILPLFDSGTADGFLYYVMPYVEGETLRTKLDRETQLGIGESVNITTEVADALDYAHRHAVIHRDIKPENILLHDGRPMVADFGIALAVSAAAGGRMTETGLSLGTPHYMSPEQATAEKDITARSDIYSLASVLYEMLTGNPPHTGASAQQIIMKIVTEEAQPVTQRRKSVPPNVAAALSKALEKVPADRFESAKTFAEALRNPAFTVAGGQAVAGAAGRGARHSIVAWAGWGIAVVAIGVGLWAWLKPQTQFLSRFAVAFPREQALASSAVGTHIAVSRDGSMLVYIGGDSTDGRLWIKRRDALSATPIAGTEGAYDPFISPDGSEVGFMTDRDGRSLKVASLAGGTSRTVVRTRLGTSGAYWSTDGYIYFDADAGGLDRIHSDGTDRQLVLALDTARNETGIAWPQIMPDNKVLIFRLRHTHDAPGDFTIVAVRLGTTERHVLAPAVSARVLGNFILMVTADGTLQATHFDERSLELSGSPTLVATGVRVSGTYAGVDFETTDNGGLYYVTGTSGVASQLEWVDRDGRTTPVDSAWRGSGEILGLALSPDGKRAAIELSRSDASGGDIWIKQLPAGPLTRLTLDPVSEPLPSWSGDGRDVVFMSGRVHPDAVFATRADGTGAARMLARTKRAITEAFESPDGRWLVARTAQAESGAGDILAMEIGRDSVLKPIIATPVAETDPSMSSDGHWLAYVSTSSGRREVYVRPFPDVNSGVWQISTDGGWEPRWAHSGHELFFRSLVSLDMMAVDVETTPVFHAGSPHSLFHTDAATGLDYQRYDVSPDDRRFLMVGRSGRDQQPQLVRVENLLQDLMHRKSP